MPELPELPPQPRPPQPQPQPQPQGMPDPSQPTRRSALRLASVAGLAAVGPGCALLTACSGSDPAPTIPRPVRTSSTGAASPDQLAAARTADRARRLLAQVVTWQASLRAGGRGPSAALAALLPLVAADHREHLRALGAPEVPPGASPSPSQRRARPAPEVIVSGERGGAVQALTDVAVTSAPVAALLTRIAASRAVHADLLAAAAGVPAPPALPPALPLTPAAPATAAAPSASSSGAAGPTTGARLDPATQQALGRLLSGEHAAVYAYGVISARAGSADRARARLDWQGHIVRRDTYAATLLAGGGQPPAARPGYDLGGPLNGAAAVRALAGRVENGLVTVAVAAVAATSGPVRADVAREAVEAARRSAAWTGRPVALPG